MNNLSTMIPVQETDHAGTGRALLIDQFRGQAGVSGILGSVLNQIQDIEDATFAMIAARILGVAVDAQLDSIGDLVGETRQGRADLEYREAIKLRIRVNRSQGAVEDVLNVANISTGGDFIYTEYYPAAFEVEAFDHAAPRALRDLLGQARPAAVRGVLVTSTWGVGDVFFFDGDTPGDVADPGIWDYTGSTSDDLMTWAVNT